MAPPPPTPLKPFQLLEINIMSAQDLEPISKKMRTYATASIHQNRKLSTCVDAEGKSNPTWNDKFVFRVDEEFLRRDTSAIMIEIYAVHWFKDVLVGTVRVLVGNLVPPPPSRAHHHGMGTRFVALQVRRPSGRPQGILNIGVALLDSSIRSMPLYRQLSISAVGYRDLMAGPPTCQRNQSDEKRDKDDRDNNNNKNLQGSNAMNPILRRTRSERSERMTFDDDSLNSSSIAAVPTQSGAANKESSILSIMDGYDPFKGMKMVKGKASSVISGAELREKPKNNNSNKSKASSVLSDSIFSKQSSGFHKMRIKDANDNKKSKNVIESFNEKQPPLPLQKNINAKYAITATKKKSGNNNHGSVVWSDSEVGPSPSEVAAAMAERRLYPLNHQDDQSSSVLDGWSLDESVEGLRSKLERWRMELPPLYDRGGGGDLSSSSHRSSGRHVRRHTDGGGISNDGMFSCFGNIFGYECQCVCGKPPRGRRSLSARFHSPSTLTPGRSFV